MSRFKKKYVRAVHAAWVAFLISGSFWTILFFWVYLRNASDENWGKRSLFVAECYWEENDYLVHPPEGGWDIRDIHKIEQVSLDGTTITDWYQYRLIHNGKIAFVRRLWFFEPFTTIDARGLHEKVEGNK